MCSYIRVNSGLICRRKFISVFFLIYVRFLKYDEAVKDAHDECIDQLKKTGWLLLKKYG